MKSSATKPGRSRAEMMLLAIAAWIVLMAAEPAIAQHRAVRLGNPSTRFAPPLTQPEQLRTLLTEEKMRADVASDGRVVWEMANLAAQSSQRVCVVLLSRQPGSLPFAPALRGLCAQPAESRCSTRVVGVPAILVEVVDLADPIEVKQPVTYEIRVTNQGSATLTNIRLVCLVPDLQEFVSGSGVTAVRADGRRVEMEPLPTLASKAVATWRVVTKAVKEGDARFKVELTSDQFQRSIDEDESTTQY